MEGKKPSRYSARRSFQFWREKEKGAKITVEELTKTFVVSSKYVSLVTHALETAGHVYTSPIRAYIPLLLTLINYERQRRFVKFCDKIGKPNKVKRCKNLMETHY